MMMSTITSITKPAAMMKAIMRNTETRPLSVSAPRAARILSGKWSRISREPNTVAGPRISITMAVMIADSTKMRGTSAIRTVRRTSIETRSA